MGWSNGWKFDVSKATDQQSFEQFMEFIRSNLGVDGIVMQDARRLPPQQDDPQFKDLELYGGNGTVITLKLRTDNLYVVGFSNTDGQWFRFNGGSPIPGTASEEMPVNESYTSANGIGPLDVVKLSTDAVQTAIRSLAGYSGGPNNDLGKWLRTLIVSFVESSRFTTVANTVANAMGGTEQVLSGHPIGQIRNWSSLSTALIEAVNDVVQDPNINIFLQFARACGINNAYQAAVALGLVMIKSTRRDGRMLMQYGGDDIANDADADYNDVALGITLLEVLSVVILNIDGEDPGDLYGTVRVRDSFGSVDLFARDRSHVQSVRPGDRAELVWPDRAISAADDLVIDLDLKDRDKDPSPDDEVSRGEVVWNSLTALSSDFNVVLSTLVTGKDGSAQVFYAVLADAVVATVEVLLIDGDGESVPDVYGTITAAINMGPPAGTSLDYDLFRQTRSEQVSVPVNTNIPLRRRVITAVLGSPLTVAADLWDKDSLPDPSPDDQIALGSVDFQPGFQGSDAKQITGPNGKVEVHVTWSVSHETHE